MNNTPCNMLFYSLNCDVCKNLLIILNNEQLSSYFKFICVDNMLHNLPSYVKMVPTMIVTDINKPLVGQEIFEYIQKIKFIRQKKIMDTNKQSIIQQNLVNMAGNAKEGPIGFKESEMSSISDSFAYKDIDMPMVQSFVNVVDKHLIYTPPQQKNETINKTTQDQLISSLQNSRKDQEKEYGELLKQDRLKRLELAQQKNPSLY